MQSLINAFANSSTIWVPSDVNNFATSLDICLPLLLGISRLTQPCDKVRTCIALLYARDKPDFRPHGMSMATTRFGPFEQRRGSTFCPANINMVTLASPKTMLASHADQVRLNNEYISRWTVGNTEICKQLDASIG